MPVHWNDGLNDEVAQRLIGALNEIDGRIEAGAKGQLYPGHGKVTGTLQRAIQAVPAERSGDSIIGAVGVGKEASGYALPIHRLYRYLVIGLEQVRPVAIDIVNRYIRSRS